MTSLHLQHSKFSDPTAALFARTLGRNSLEEISLFGSEFDGLTVAESTSALFKLCLSILNGEATC
jgi:hypothetical protein